MGALSILHAFDHDRHVQVVVPSLLGAHEASVVDFARECRWLDDHLALKTPRQEPFRTAASSVDGGCRSSDCPARRRCPFHPEGTTDERSERVMELFQRAVLTSCVDECVDPCTLGGRGQFYDFARWYAWERGDDEDEMEIFEHADDPLADLLTRLSRRGAVWGGVSGGFGEGVLGWLSAPEARSLYSRLRPLDLRVDAPVPDTFVDRTTGTDLLPEMRRIMTVARQMLVEVSREGVGVLLRRR